MKKAFLPLLAGIFMLGTAVCRSATDRTSNTQPINAALGPSSTEVGQNTANTVYICRSGTAKVYHSKPDCYGLRKCTHPIIEVSLKEAVDKYKRRACQLCE